MMGSRAQMRICLIIILLCTSMVAADVPLQFAVPAMQSGLAKLEQWTPMVEYLERKCNFEINLLIVKDHWELIEGLRNRFYDVGFMNALWEHRLTREGDFLPRARLTVGGFDHYFTHIIVNKDSVFRRIDELSGDYFALTVPYESLGGFYIPLLMCRQAGIEASEVFRQVVFSETYMSILKGVAFGVIEAGAVTSDVLNSPGMKEYSSEVRNVGISKALPHWSMVAYRSHKSVRVNRFIRELIEMNLDPEGVRILDEAGYTGFVPVEDTFDTIPPDYLDMIEEIDALPR